MSTGHFPPATACNISTCLRCFIVKYYGTMHIPRAISLVSVYPSERQLVCVHKKDSVGTFIFPLVSLFIIGKPRKQPTCPSTPPPPWIGWNKLGYIRIVEFCALVFGFVFKEKDTNVLTYRAPAAADLSNQTNVSRAFQG